MTQHKRRGARKPKFTPKEEWAILRNKLDLIAWRLGFKNWRALEESCGKRESGQ